MFNQLKYFYQIIEKTPTRCGIYQMIDQNGDIIYIGKAKNIKKRLLSYSRFNALSYRIKQMVLEVEKVVFVITETESQALLLEAQLIKKIKPKYNIQLKDDKSFPYIVIDKNHSYPRIYKYKGKGKNKNCIYYGPFTSTQKVNHTINELRKIFLIRECSDSYFNARSRPCLDYQIKKCSAPCVNKISQQDYNQNTKEIEFFLQGKNSQLQIDLKKQMQAASDNMLYEQAAKIRDKIISLTHIQSKNSLEHDIDEADIFTITQDSEGYIAISVYFIRNGQNYTEKYFYPAINLLDDCQNIIHQYILQFYSLYPCPKLVITDYITPDFITALQATINDKVKIQKITKKLTPLKNIISLNLQESLKKHKDKNLDINNIYQDIADIFCLPKQPNIIEILDNSHNQGSNNIGAIVAANKAGFLKSNYNKCSINFNRNDDYIMLQESLEKRFTKKTSNHPDLIIIDGGQGHLNAAIHTLNKLNIHISVISISKGPKRIIGEEYFHVIGKPSFQLPKDSKTLLYLQKLRDEAHRFAITSYRKKHLKTFKQSALDSIPNIGPVRKTELLKHFGSFDSIKNSSIDELTKAPGISKKTAKIVYNHLHSLINS